MYEHGTIMRDPNLISRDLCQVQIVEFVKPRLTADIYDAGVDICARHAENHLK